jgi:hypothetical protein
MRRCETCGCLYDSSGLIRRAWVHAYESWECGRCLRARARRHREFGWLRSQSPWDVGCPTCMAEPWHPCRGPEGGILAFHAARVPDDE